MSRPGEYKGEKITHTRTHTHMHTHTHTQVKMFSEDAAARQFSDSIVVALLSTFYIDPMNRSIF